MDAQQAPKDDVNASPPCHPRAVGDSRLKHTYEMILTPECSAQSKVRDCEDGHAGESKLIIA